MPPPDNSAVLFAQIHSPRDGLQVGESLGAPKGDARDYRSSSLSGDYVHGSVLSPWMVVTEAVHMAVERPTHSANQRLLSTGLDFRTRPVGDSGIVHGFRAQRVADAVRV